MSFLFETKILQDGFQVSHFICSSFLRNHHRYSIEDGASGVVRLLVAHFSQSRIFVNSNVFVVG
jgi:hypothetical protein